MKKKGHDNTTGDKGGKVMVGRSARLAADKMHEGLLAEDDHSAESRESESDNDDHEEMVRSSAPS
jgi:hypothetical protein